MPSSSTSTRARRSSARARCVRFACAEPGADSWVDLKARSVETVSLNGEPLDPAERRRRPPGAHGSRRRQRARRRRDDGLQPRRAGPAPGHRPRRRPRLRLRPPLPRRGPERLRLLRPARPQGPLRRHRPRAARLDRPRQRRRRADEPRHVDARHDEAARDVLHDGVRGTVRLRARRARRHTPGCPRAGVAARAARAARGRALRRDEAVVRLLPRALRDPLPVRGVPPGLRAGVQRRRDGEPGLRDLPRPVPLPRRRDARRAADAGQHGEPRDVAHVVRRHRDDEVVGRPLAQRVVRRVHVAPLPRRRDRVHRRVGRLLDRAQGVGLRRRALPVDPPGRGRRGPRRAERAAELRRHLVCQGRGDAAPAHRVRRRRPVHRRRPRLPDRQVVRQRHARRLPRRDRDGERQGPRGVVARPGC